MFSAPTKLLIKSDDNIMEYVNTIPKSKNNSEPLYVYNFTRSETKKGKETYFTEDVLKKLINSLLFKVIE